MNHTEAMISAISHLGALSEHDAEKALRVLIRVGAIRYDLHDGYVIKHGAYMDREVLRRAVHEYATPHN